jgi:hypothetical protein
MSTAVMVAIAFTVALLLVAVWFLFVRKPGMDEERAAIGPLPSSMLDTSELSRTPVTSTTPVVVVKKPVTAVKSVPLPPIPIGQIMIPEPKIELFSGLNFTGKKKMLYGGMLTQFAEMTPDENLRWTYRSMKITPGAKFDLHNLKYRAYGVGKYDVPDLFDFIKSWNQLYKATMMDRKYWARPFFIRLHDPDYPTLETYHTCMKKIMVNNIDSTTAGRRCFKSHPLADGPFTA